MAAVRLIRHATLQLEYAGRQFLVDPMFSPKGALDPAAASTNALRNPLVELPLPASQLLDYEECLVTHLHRDHLDPAAIAALPKDRPVLCQPEDKGRLEAAGFSSVVAVEGKVQRGDIEVARTSAQHGKGEMVAKMGAASGFVLSHPAEPTLFLVGDGLWCPALQAALRAFRPGAIVVNSGAAQFAQGGPVTMDADDVLAVAREMPLAQIVVAHLEAWNHCPLTRAELLRRLEDHELTARVHVPQDGESVNFL